jgi:hypothetical protein
VPILGQAVILRAAAERYDWTFGDRASLTTDTPGPPYQAGTTCSADGDCTGYVHHTYRAPGRWIDTASHMPTAKKGDSCPSRRAVTGPSEDGLCPRVWRRYRVVSEARSRLARVGELRGEVR